MRRRSGSVGDLGGQPPRSTRPGLPDYAHETRISPPSGDRGGARRVSVNGRLRGRLGLWLGGCPRGQEIQITSRGRRVDVGG